MKKTLICVGLILIVISALTAQCIPILHEHSGPRCHGYAVGRSFQYHCGNTGCDPATLYLNTVSESYFDYYDIDEHPLSEVEVGDILSYCSKGFHVAYVSATNPIYVDQIENEEKTTATLVLIN